MVCFLLFGDDLDPAYIFQMYHEISHFVECSLAQVQPEQVPNEAIVEAIPCFIERFYSLKEKLS